MGSIALVHPSEALEALEALTEAIDELGMSSAAHAAVVSSLHQSRMAIERSNRARATALSRSTDEGKYLLPLAALIGDCPSERSW